MYGHVQSKPAKIKFPISVVYTSSAALFLDMSKPFDKVPHHHLLHSLSVVGISGPLLKWFETYISNHSQKVVLNGYSSTSLPVSLMVHSGILVIHHLHQLLGWTSLIPWVYHHPLCRQHLTVPSLLNKPCRYLPARRGSNIQLDHIIWSFDYSGKELTPDCLQETHKKSLLSITINTTMSTCKSAKQKIGLLYCNFQLTDQ